MSLTEISAEELAQLFHLYHEALMEGVDGPGSGHPTWDEISREERHRLVAAMRLALLDLDFASRLPALKPRNATQPRRGSLGSLAADGGDGLDA